MKFKIFFILTIIFLFPLLLKGDNDFAKVKLNIKLDENNIIKIKSMGEDEILSGAFYGKIESTEDKNFVNANLECDFIGRSYKGRGFSCGFAVIEDLKGFCYIKNNNSEDILMADWNCNTTGGINGDAYCAGKLNIIQGFGEFAGVNGFGEINMPLAKTINSNMSSPLNINLNLKYPLSLNK
jgi:hypothetical protein